MAGIASDAVTIGGLQWLDYVHAGPRKAMTMVTSQKRRYLDPDNFAWSAYGPLLAGFRRAMNSPDRQTELERVAAWAASKDDWRATAYRESVDGFLELVDRRTTGVPVGQASWVEGELRIVFRNLLGLRKHDKADTRLLVLPYCKATELNQESADIVLHLMKSVVDQVLPEATPVVFDTRHATLFKLHGRTNRANVDACVRGLAAAYLRQWALAA